MLLRFGAVLGSTTSSKSSGSGLLCVGAAAGAGCAFDARAPTAFVGAVVTLVDDVSFAPPVLSASTSHYTRKKPKRPTMRHENAESKQKLTTGAATSSVASFAPTTWTSRCAARARDVNTQDQRDEKIQRARALGAASKELTQVRGRASAGDEQRGASALTFSQAVCQRPWRARSAARFATPRTSSRRAHEASRPRHAKQSKRRTSGGRCVATTLCGAIQKSGLLRRQNEKTAKHSRVGHKLARSRQAQKRTRTTRRPKDAKEQTANYTFVNCV